MKYSICIRTLGMAEEKLDKLVRSINKLNLQPEEVIIVIAKGYKLPNINLENKRIVYSEKGMLLQRIVGFEEAKTEYVLLLDDDVIFDENLVEELFKPIEKGLCNISFPIYKDLLLKGRFRKIISAATLSSIPKKKCKNTFVKIIGSGGFSYNSNLSKSNKYLYSESAPGMCVFAKRECLININLRKELWIDNVGYPLREDAVLIYKLHLNGNKVVGVQDINIIHLDGGSNEQGRNLKAAYSNGYNQILFWKRFICCNSDNKLKRIKASISIKYWAISTIIYLSLRFLINRDNELLKESFKGIKGGFEFIKNDDNWRNSIWQV